MTHSETRETSTAPAGEVVWAASTACSGGDCVQVRLADGDVLVRHTEQLDAEPLRFTSREWRAFVAGVKAGEFDLPGGV